MADWLMGLRLALCRRRSSTFKMEQVQSGQSDKSMREGNVTKWVARRMLTAAATYSLLVFSYTGECSQERINRPANAGAQSTLNHTYSTVSNLVLCIIKNSDTTRCYYSVVEEYD
jgi:hypothetical protein